MLQTRMAASSVETRDEASTSKEEPATVEEMRQCTRRLDEILQQLHDEGFDETDADKFVEAEENHEGKKESDLVDDSKDFSSSVFPPALPELLNVSMWGSHDDAASGNTSSFRKIRIPTPLPRNRIVGAACSRFHTLFLNDMGMVFAYGHNLDGALGIGEETSSYVAEPTLVDYFFDNLIVVQQLSCAGDQLTGVHSAAVSQDGSLFTWGVGVALGTGTLRSASTPQRIEVTDSGFIQEGEGASRCDFQSISCGSGFCVAITREGQAFSWGKWGEGRLGLGRIPIIARTSRRHGGGAVRKQFQLFQLHPKRIQAIYPAESVNAHSEDVLFVKVACGDAHCVGLTSKGELVTWGRGSSGQQGRGDINDTLAPTLVPELTGTKWRDVAAGENWTMVLSMDGEVWTWGGCGAAALGHGLHGSEKNALLAQTILAQHQRLLSQRKKAPKTCPRLPQLKWMKPKLIACFSSTDIRICQISAGAQHAAAISDTGDLYMWGDRYTGESIGDMELSSLPKLVNSGQRVRDDASDQTADIGTHSVDRVVCGGRQTVAFTSGSFLARSMAKLYRDSSDHHLETSTTAADLVLVVSGQRLQAHKLLLAQRSPVLRQLILDEEQNRGHTNALFDTEPMELLLPRLRADVARALLEYMYTDNYTLEVGKSSQFLVRDVLRAAKVYQMPSLVQLCRSRLFSASPTLDDVAEEEELDDTNSEENAEDFESIDGDNRTLNEDMRFALSDDVWADTVLVAEGRNIPVHRCMLIARSEYFRALLTFPRRLPEDEQTAKTKAVVTVEDSYAGVVRVLRFIYYDQVTLPEVKTIREDDFGEDVSDLLLEDLVAADKYGLERMKRLCEHAIRVTVVNCLDVLAVAELVRAAHLKQVALRFVQTNLPQVTERQEEFFRFQQSFPRLLEELYTSLRDSSQEELLLRDWYTEVKASLDAQREESELQWGKKATASFPWVSLSLTVAFGTMYLSVMHTQEHEFSAVPATNLVAIAAIIAAFFMGYL